MSERSQFHHALLAWYELAVEVGEALPAGEREALSAWESTHLDGHSVSTMDWPGWVKHLPARPLLGQPFTPPKRFRHPSVKVPIGDGLRWDVWGRDNFTCLACGSRRHLTVDHVIPESKGGPTVFANLQTLCRSCNSRKG